MAYYKVCQGKEIVKIILQENFFRILKQEIYYENKLEIHLSLLTCLKDL